MADAGSYRESHTDSGRGRRYDRFYATDPWVKFLWLREQQVLEGVLRTYFAGREINLLDFACGTGRITGFLETRVTAAVGIDISEPMLESARQNLKCTELIRADLTRDPVLQGRKFNLITAFRFFANAEPGLRREALKALVPLLAEDGCLVFNNHRNRSSPAMVLVHAVQTRPAGPHIRTMSIAEMRNLVAPFGLEMVKVYPIGLWPSPIGRLPLSWHHAIDRVAQRIGWLAHFSQSPIGVFRRRSWLAGARQGERGQADGIR